MLMSDDEVNTDANSDADDEVGLVVFLCWHSLLLIECYCSDRWLSWLYSSTHPGNEDGDISDDDDIDDDGDEEDDIGL